MNKINVIFLGGIFPDSLEKEIIDNSIGPIQYAANNLQKKIISGLVQNGVSNFHVISAPFIAPFPQGYKKIVFCNTAKEDRGHYRLTSVPFFNLFGIRNFSREFSVDRELVKHISSGPTVILVYSLHSPLLRAAIKAKAKKDNLYVICIVPDLPQYMVFGDTSTIYKVLKAFDLRRIERSLKQVSGFVFLTDQMNDVLNINHVPYTVVEGIGNQNTFEESHMKPSFFNEQINNRYILYTGTLDFQYGIVELLEAFVNIKKNKSQLSLKLVICGDGDSKHRVINTMESNPDIYYLGQLPPSDVRYLQRNADFLINPRRNEGDYTRFSFPSKTMEYLSSGRPVLCYKLDGIPSEYNDYLKYIDPDSDNGLEYAMKEMIELSDQKKIDIGAKGASFIKKQKNPKVMVKKVIELIETILKGKV